MVERSEIFDLTPRKATAYLHENGVMIDTQLVSQLMEENILHNGTRQPNYKHLRTSTLECDELRKEYCEWGKVLEAYFAFFRISASDDEAELRYDEIRKEQVERLADRIYLSSVQPKMNKQAKNNARKFKRDDDDANYCE